MVVTECTVTKISSLFIFSLKFQKDCQRHTHTETEAANVVCYCVVSL